MNILSELKTFLWVGFCVSSCLFFSCKDETGQLGLELQNPNEKVLVYNDSSAQINTFTLQRADTINLFRGTSDAVEYFLLGYQNDPTLGTFENSFMTEVQYNKPFFEGPPIVDSIMFYLNYTQHGISNTAYPTIYGDSTQQQIVSIYELNKDTSLLGINGQPNTDAVINTFADNNPIASFYFYPKLTDTVLRIKLPKSLGERLMDTSKYENQETFQNSLFRGFYFKAQPISGTGAITSFTLAGETRMELYYHDDSLERSTVYNIYSTTYRCNVFNRTYNQNIKYVPFGTIPNSSYEQDQFYLKNNNSFESLIQISGLQTWADSGYFTINKASLTIEAENNSDESSLFKPLQYLQVLQFVDLENGLDRMTVPEYYDLNGFKYPTFVDTVGYELNIKNTIYNAIQDGKDQVNLILSTPTNLNLSSATRTVFKGANSSNPIKLQITYTKFNVE